MKCPTWTGYVWSLLKAKMGKVSTLKGHIDIV